MREYAVLPLMLGLTALASAEVCWDQSNYDLDAVALCDQDFTDYPTYSSFMVTDVSNSQGWIVYAVETYFTYGHGNWPVGQDIPAKLNIIPRNGCNLPDNAYDPSQGMSVTAQLTSLGDALKLRVEDLYLYLPAGDHWVGLTPVLPFEPYGQEFHLAAPIINCNTAWRNPGGSFGCGADWTWAYDLGYYWQDTYDAAIKIELRVPEPASALLLGLAGLLIRRR